MKKRSKKYHYEIKNIKIGESGSKIGLIDKIG